MAQTENQTDLASETESAQQMVELQRPLLSSQPTNLSSSYFQQQQQHQHVDDYVTINIKEMIQDCGDGRLSPDCCIYRVPPRIRAFKEGTYTPTAVSIGPYHYGNKTLQEMEEHKCIMVKRFAQRAKPSLDDLVGRVKHLEPKVRASYSETIKLSEQELVKLTLIDAGFIIELLILYHEKKDKVYTDAKLSQPWLNHSVRQDLMLIENQLPFFVIKELFNEAFPPDHHSRPPSILKLVYEYFGYYNRQKKRPHPDVKINHFTDLLRSFYLPGEMSERQSVPKGEGYLLYSANALQEAGIKLKAGTGKCLLDLNFSGHNILEIPQIVVEKRTEMLFLNMIVLEQCLYPFDTWITDYAIVLNCLMETHKDVDLLVHKKIVLNYGFDSNDVASLFGVLTDSYVRRNFNSGYLTIFQRLNGYCQDPWRQMKATLRRDYCRTPWQILASIAAILLLFLTIVQTIFSILQVVK